MSNHRHSFDGFHAAFIIRDSTFDIRNFWLHTFHPEKTYTPSLGARILDRVSSSYGRNRRVSDQGHCAPQERPG